MGELKISKNLYGCFPIDVKYENNFKNLLSDFFSSLDFRLSDDF